MNATIELKTIAPQEALFLLENLHDNQRTLRTKAVSILEKEMRQGTFKLSTDAILILRGKLGNGQHRLTAVVQSGKPQQFLVLKTNDESIYKVLDCGMRRTIGDAMNLANQTNVIAAARWTMAMEAGQAKPGSGLTNFIVTRSQVMEFIETNIELLQDASRVATQLYGKSFILSKAIATAFLCIAERKSARTRHAAMELLDAVYTGENCHGPANDLRNRLIANRGSKAKLSQAYIMGLLIKAFIDRVNRRPTTMLRFYVGENYPAFPTL